MEQKTSYTLVTETVTLSLFVSVDSDVSQGPDVCLQPTQVLFQSQPANGNLMD